MDFEIVNSPEAVKHWQAWGERETARHRVGPDVRDGKGSAWAFCSVFSRTPSALRLNVEVAVACLARAYGIFPGDALTLEAGDAPDEADEDTGEMAPMMRLEVSVRAPAAQDKKPTA